MTIKEYEQAIRAGIPLITRTTGHARTNEVLLARARYWKAKHRAKAKAEQKGNHAPK